MLTYSMLIKSNKVLNFSSNYYVYRKDINNSRSSSIYRPNSNMFDIFKACDEIEEFSKINNCEIAFNDKKEIISTFYELICTKYSNPYNLDKGLLSARCNIFLIDKLFNNSCKSKRL